MAAAQQTMLTTLIPEMDWNADDPVKTFRKFKQRIELAFKTFLKDATDEEKVSYLLLLAGDDGLEIRNSWDLSPEQEKDPNKILEKFEKHLEPKTNHRIFRYEFQSMRQGPEESISDYMSRLKNVADKCNFKDKTEKDGRLLDQMIWGCAYKKVQKTLIGKHELTLAAAVKEAVQHESTEKCMTTLTISTQAKEAKVDAISSRKHTPSSKQKASYRPPQKQSSNICRNCGTEHEFNDRKKCPAYGSTCNGCGKPNHWRKMCRSKGKSKPQEYRGYRKANPKHVHYQQEEQYSSGEETLSVGAIYVHEVEHKNDAQNNEAYTTFQIKKKIGKKTTNINLRLKIDTGAQSNVMPVEHYQQIFPENMTKGGEVKAGILTPSSTVLSAYGGDKIPHLGKTTISGKHKGREVKCTFFVTKSKGPSILGLAACQQLGIITIHEIQATPEDGKIKETVPIKDRPAIHNKEQLIKMYPECFDDTVGCFEEEYHITVDPDVEPVIHPPRRVPLELREKLKKQLEEMTEKGVISEVTQPTDWVNSIVIKEKPNGKLRICLDSRDLNLALKRNHYPTPTLEEITPSLAGAKVFSKLDASNGYWNIKIDEESSLLTTFNTPYGRFKFNRLPFGLKVSQDVFQRKIDETYKGCKGAIGIADDIQVYGKTDNDHDFHLHEAMEKTRQAGIKLNASKCIIKESECKFFGMIYTAEGVKPDPEKVKAIHDIKPPQDEKELRSLLGLIQYMSAFIPKLADRTTNIRELLKEDVEYKWSASHTEDLNKIKQLISEKTTLQYYDREKPVILQVDASIKGVGAALIQDGKPIAFASKALSPAETRYANIERELLAVVYGCEKFHTYLYGRSFEVESDHRPLEQINKKNLTKAPNRLQRLLLRLQSYDMSIRYKPGKEMLLADALSRLSQHDKQEMDGLKVQIHHLVKVTSVKLERIREETSEDEELQLLAQTVTQGWPEKRKETQAIIHEYWTIRDDISVEDGVLLAGSRMIIPKSMRAEVLEMIHQGHLGIEKCILRAKSAVYWPGMYKQIEKAVAACPTCQKHKNSQQKEEMMPTEIPSRPWQTVGMDLFTTNDQWFLLLVDYYSKFPFVKSLANLKASTVTSSIRGIFAEQGIPAEVICDNGTQFTSQEFRQLANEYGFKITTSSPHYPKGHGFIERHVQTVKKTLIKCKESRSDPNLAMLAIRTTPIKPGMKSPAELLNGRKYKDILPTKVPPPLDQEETRAKLEKAQQAAKQHYDTQAKNLPELAKGQSIHVQDPIRKTWSPGKVNDKATTPRSYVVETDAGRQLRRNRVHIRPTPEVKVPAATTPETTPAASATQTTHESTLQPPTIAAPHATTPSATKPTSAAMPSTTKSTRTRSNIQPPVRYR
ncbi:uncharacterized protein K02A2.6-like [Branchiostoma floridae]|uniref:Gypsy retrotransposon integrase-like protein 1 n=1 Tax=Branchiostoma floridae TaxID=7739 RepID=A0A9J7HH86_BRAFL|nr:uncharacterized protein K02A2.6-like [Branchiostoma floridae]